MKKGTRLILTPKTEKGKKILSKVGEIWVFLEAKEYVGFTNKEGPWLWIKPLENYTVADYSRWVHITEDLMFKLNLEI